jgi:hypothetical protein
MRKMSAFKGLGPLCSHVFWKLKRRKALLNQFPRVGGSIPPLGTIFQ